MTQVATAMTKAGPGKRAPTPLEAALADPKVQDGVYRYAFRRVRHEQNAEDLAQQSFEVALRRDSTGSGWKGPPPPVLMFLGSVLNGVLWNKWRADKRRPKIVDEEAEEAPSEAPHAEQAMVAVEDEADQARVKAELRAYFESQPNGRIPLAMLTAAENGVRGGKALVEQIGCTPEEMTRARKRVQHHLNRLLGRVVGDEPS